MIEIQFNSQEVDMLLTCLDLEKKDPSNSNKTNQIINDIINKITEKVNE